MRPFFHEIYNRETLIRFSFWISKHTCHMKYGEFIVGLCDSSSLSLVFVFVCVFLFVFAFFFLLDD